MSYSKGQANFLELAKNHYYGAFFGCSGLTKIIAHQNGTSKNIK
ncbi:hypothetical protein [Oleiphilus messinensis]|nr:hypothetical protein [Oleiphilus messinensis]